MISEDNWNDGFRKACFSGHVQIIDLLILSLLNNKIYINWNKALERARHGGHIGVVKLLISLPLNRGIVANWNECLENACRGNYHRVVGLAIKNGAMKCGNCHKSLEDHL